MDLAQLHRDVVFGRAGGRIIWQPRIGCWFSDRTRSGEPLPERYRGMTLPDIFRSLGCSDRLYWAFNDCFMPAEDPAVAIRHQTQSDGVVECTVQTPVGRQVARWLPNAQSSYPRQIKRIIETEDELRVAAWRARHTTWQWDQKLYEKNLARYGDLGAPTVFLPRVNIQDLYINTMGVEAAIYALMDWPDTVEDYFAALEELHDRLIDLVNASPIDIINFGDNLHAGTLPPRLYEQYVQPVYQRRCAKLHGAGKFVHSHWDGDTRSLLPFARDSGLDGIEAITPQPQGDVTLDEVKRALGDELFYLDGIPAVLFDDYYPLKTLEDFTRRVIELFAPKLVLGISDELSSTGDIERIRVVGRIVDEYNASCAKPASR